MIDGNHTFNFTIKPLRHAMFMAACTGLALTPGPDPLASQPMIEEIVVTATRRDENLQRVAIPMTSVSGEALERAFAQDLRDLTNASPNVILEPVGIFQNSAAFVIRGQGTADIESASDSKVAILVDGVVQGRVSTALGDMLDVNAVELLRGPQGTLFGRNTIAGAVLVNRNAPQFDDTSFGASVQAGNFGRLDVKGIANLPLSETVALRLAAKSTNHDGYWKNTFNDERRGANDRLTVLPSLRWAPNERTDVVVRGEWGRTRDDTYPGASHHYCRDDPFTLFTGGGSGAGGSPDNDLIILTQTLHNLIVGGQDPATAAANAAELCGRPIEDQSASEEYRYINTEFRGQGADNDQWGITVQVDHELPDLGIITYIGNYRDTEESITFMLEGSRHDLFAGRRDQEHDQTSHELRFASTFSDRFDFVAGAYYFEQEFTMLQESFGILFAPNILLTQPGAPPTFTHPATRGQAGWSNQSNDAWAVFTQGNWHVNDQLTLMLGGRFTSEKKSFRHCGVGAGDPTAAFSSSLPGCQSVPLWEVDFTEIVPVDLTPQYGLTPAIGFDSSGGAEGGCRPELDPSGAQILCNNLLRGSESWTEFTATAGLRYQFNDDIMGFATWAQGFKSGGFNGRATTPTTIGPFDPETADNFEIGVKSQWFDNRVQVNLNAFYTDIQDFQQAFIRPSQGAGGQETVGSNLGSVETKGFEAEIRAVPTQNLSLWTSVGYLNTKQKGFCADGDGFSGTDPDNPPDLPGPFSQDLEQCAPAERVTNEVGQFLGWLVPTDNSNLLPGPRSPKWSVSAGFAYDWNLDQFGRLTIAADWIYRTKQLVSASRATELEGVQQFNGDFLNHMRGSSDIINASLTWRDTSERFRVSGFVKNLTNEIHNQATTNVGGLLEIRVPNIRRHWGVELAYNL